MPCRGCAVEIVLESDLVDSCKPGDRVAVVGIFRPLASSGSGGSTSGAYRSVVVGVSVEKLTHDRYKWRGEDIANINKIAHRLGGVRGDGHGSMVVRCLSSVAHTRSASCWAWHVAAVPDTSHTP